MKKIIVTGGNGFIGSNLVKFLIDKNYFVINIDKNTYSDNSYILKKLSSKNYSFHCKKFRRGQRNYKRIFYFARTEVMCANY